MNRQYTGVNSPAPEERKAQIYLEYHDKVLSYVRGKISDSHEAEDIASSVFLKVYQKLDTYDCTRSSISTWIYTITRNTVIDYFRRHHTFCGYSDLDVENTELCSDSLDGEEVLIQLSESLLKLKEKERELIILHYYKGYSLKQIAEVMGMSYVNAKVIHSKALNHLREDFKDE